MPRPLPIPVRRTVFRRWQAGDSAPLIANALHLAPRTVQRLLRRFRSGGANALGPSYRRLGGNRPDARAAVFRAASALRQQHPHWGAPLIWVLLRRRFRRPTLVGPRTLQRWFAQAGLGPSPKGRHPALDDRRATRPHAVWQMDGCEQLRLASGERVCWLRIADEHTGAILLTVVFPVAFFSQVPPAMTQAALRKAFTTWGLPGALRVDNGPPWGSAGDLPTDLALWVLGLRVGMMWNPPRQPRRNGVIERFQGVGQCWLEPESCGTPRELQRRANRLDRLQREEYPVAEGKARLAVFPALAHSGRVYNRAWEREHWDRAAVADYLAAGTVVRRVDSKGMISIYNGNRYVGKGHSGKAVWVTFDPQAGEWIICDGKGTQIRCLPAPEICPERILSLSVSKKRQRGG